MSNKLLKISFLFYISLIIFLNFIYAQNLDEEYLKANEAFNQGEYPKARKLFKSIVEKGIFEQGVGYFETYLAVGEYETGLDEINKYLKKYPDNPFLFNKKGKLLTTVGKYKEAENSFQSAGKLKQKYWQNKLDLAELFFLQGRKEDAKELCSEIYQQFQRGSFNNSVDLMIISAIAAAKIGEFHSADQIFKTTYRIDPKNVILLLFWADLYRQKYNNADAQHTFEEALELNSKLADLHSAYAHSFESFLAKEEIAQKALELNPNHVESLNIMAELHILDSRYDEAESVLHKAININPSYIKTLANLASVHHFRGQLNKLNEIEKQAKKINPVCGDFYSSIANNCGLRFRYKDAVNFCFKAVEIEPDNWQAHSLLGANLLRIGRAEEAKKHLEIGHNNDNFNLFAYNSLGLIDDYENFDILQSDHFVLKIHESESGILGQGILNLAEEAYDTLSNYYPYLPLGKILLEAYNDHADFGVRISGLPNLDLLGVCFGDIVAFDTPRAQSESDYNWARTLWHELAHVMTIGVSDHRVPRWLTEGLSVYEEQRARSEWKRKMDIQLFAALDQDKLLSLEKINSGFTRPEFPGQVMLSYYQSMKIVEFLANQYGFDVIIKLLTGFKERKSFDQNFEDVFGRSINDISDDFFDYLKKERKKLKDVIVINKNIFGEKDKKKSPLEKLFGKDNSPYFDYCMDGYKLLGEDEYEQAEEKFYKAIDIYSFYVSSSNPYLGLAEIYRKQEKRTSLINILEEYLKITEFGNEEAIELAEYFTEDGEFEKAEYYYNRSFYLEPYEIKNRIKLAEIHKQQKEFDKEIEQRKIIVALEPVDRAKSLYELAFSFYNDQQKSKAKMEVLKALELAPGYRDAQKLLMLCVN